MGNEIKTKAEAAIFMGLAGIEAAPPAAIFSWGYAHDGPVWALEWER